MGQVDLHLDRMSAVMILNWRILQSLSDAEFIDLQVPSLSSWWFRHTILSTVLSSFLQMLAWIILGISVELLWFSLSGNLDISHPIHSTVWFHIFKTRDGGQSYLLSALLCSLLLKLAAFQQLYHQGFKEISKIKIYSTKFRFEQTTFRENKIISIWPKTLCMVSELTQ